MSAIAAASRKVLDLVLGDQAGGWQVYSYRESFAELWGAIRDQSLGPKAAGVVILLDGVPRAEAPSASVVSTAEYVTGYDWLATWLSSLSAAPPCRVVLLDLAAPHGSSARRLIAGYLEEFQFARVERPETHLKLFAALAALCEATHKRPLAKNWLEAREGVRDLWISRLTRPGKRHEVSNLLAPYVMAYDLKARGWPGADELVHQLESDPLRGALLIQARVLGLLDTSRAGTVPLPRHTKLRVERLTASDPFGRFQNKVRFLLVDDQFELGYREIVRCLLFGNKEQDESDTVRLDCSATPGEPLEWLESQAPGKPPRFLGENCVLLLDLRLFASRPDGESEEKRFYERLLRVYDSSRLRSPALNYAATAARHLVSGSRGLEGLAHLAFFPLLLSQADPSLPIVLFSSSHQRTILKSLHSRANIVTEFGKPIVSGYDAGESGPAAIDDLIDAIADALRLHKIRVVWEALVHFAHARPVAATGVRTLTLDARAVDETVNLMSSEFRRLLSARRYSDALAVPDNILERLGKKTTPPEILANLDVVFLSELHKGSGRPWHQFLDAALNNRALSFAIIDACPTAFLALRDARATPHNDALASISAYFSQLKRPDQGWMLRFEKRDPSSAALIREKFGSLEALMDQAFSKAEEKALNELQELGDALGVSCYYSVLAGMRNLKAHFRVDAGDDDKIENFAVWTWLWFLGGLSGGTALQAGDTITPQSLVMAKRRQWLPRSAFSTYALGKKGCQQIAMVAGHLIRLGILKPSLNMKTPAAFALRLAEEDGAAPRTVVAIGEAPKPAPPLPAPVTETAAVMAETALQPADRREPYLKAPIPDVPKIAQAKKAKPPAGSTHRPFADGLRELRDQLNAKG